MIQIQNVSFEYEKEQGTLSHIDLNIRQGECVVTKALANGLLVISAGSDVLRLVPPLVITKEHIDEMIEKLEKSLA